MQRLTVRHLNISLALLLLSPTLFLPGRAQEQKRDADVLLPVRLGGKWGYINSSGSVVVAPQFDYAFPFSSGLALVVTNRKIPLIGFLDETGQMAIKPHFWRVSAFSEGLAPVDSCGENGFINSKGHVVIYPQFVEARPFSEGLAAVRVSERTEGGQTGPLKWGFVDPDGNMAIPPQFDHASEFSEGLAVVGLGDFAKTRWGFIDRAGKFVIEPKFSAASSFSEGLAPVEVGGVNRETSKDVYVNEGGKYGFINKAGEMVIEPQFASAKKFSEGLSKVRVGEKWGDGKWGYIDKTGRMVIKPELEEVTSDVGDCESFSEGLACIAVQEKLGYIDKAGGVVIQPQFDLASSFSNGIAAVALGRYSTDNPKSDLVSSGDMWGYIDKTGKYIWKPTK